ncbi:MAG: hypothetical protein V1661_01460 [bacterium]
MRSLTLLTLSVVSFVACGDEFSPSPSQTSPFVKDCKLMVDSRFTTAQKVMILEMINKWNEVGREYMDRGGQELITYGGVLYNAGSYTSRNRSDGLKAIYLGADDEYYKSETSKYKGMMVLGLAVGREDILIFDFNIFNLFKNDSVQYEEKFRLIVLHELGHYLGLGDDKKVSGKLMSSPGNLNDKPVIKFADIRDLCSIYGCTHEPLSIQPLSPTANRTPHFIF